MLTKLLGEIRLSLRALNEEKKATETEIQLLEELEFIDVNGLSPTPLDTTSFFRDMIPKPPPWLRLNRISSL
jgi:hypothetical protein